MDIWDLFDCLQTYKKIIKEEEDISIRGHGGGHNVKIDTKQMQQQ
ncbi:MAG: hypothetical protein WBE68_21725 [Candidatus Nitrosopolaris sp.]